MASFMWCAVALALLAAGDEMARLQEALALEQAGDDAAALASLDLRVRVDPTWAVPRIEAARIRLKLGEHLESAQLDLEAARSLAPENPRVHYLFGELMKEQGHQAEAVRSLELAVALRADYTEAHERLAAIYFDQRDWLRAELHYRAVAKSEPARIPARLQLAQALEREGRLVDAEIELKKLLDEQPTSLVVARHLADFYDRTGQPKLAARVRETLDPAVKRKMRSLKKTGR